MLILGISAYYHDASAAIIRDGCVVAAAAEERYTRQKHDANFPQYAIETCLRLAKIRIDDLDHVVFYELPELKFTRVLVSTMARFPWFPGRFVDAMQVWLSDRLWTRNQLSSRLGLSHRRLKCVPHHASHAAQAFYGSGFSEAAVMVIDAVGEWSTTSLWTVDPQGEFAMLGESRYPHSIGLFYAAMTAYLGFRPNDAECSTMALAAFGRPRYLKALRNVITVDDSANIRIGDQYFDFLAQAEGIFKSPLIEILGKPRSFHQVLPFDALEDEPNRTADAEEQRYADIATSVQALLEEVVIKLARFLRRISGQRRLCFAGGVALNSVLNTRLLDEGIFEEIYIPPDPGDGGAAVGAAMYTHLQHGGLPAAQPASPYVGESFGSGAVRQMLDRIDPQDWEPYIRPGARPVKKEDLAFRLHETPSGCLAEVAEDLAAGQIVGWLQGRFEMGPRALGNRSILCDAGNLAAVNRLRTAVKSRAAFRPFAISICDEDADRALLLAGRPHLSRWMQMVVPIRSEALPHLRGGAHIDGTTRVQICLREENALFYDLLAEFGRRRPYRALLNTSFNDDGDPLIATPEEALLVFARSDLDVLVIENLVVRKQRES